MHRFYRYTLKVCKHNLFFRKTFRSAVEFGYFSDLKKIIFFLHIKYSHCNKHFFPTYSESLNNCDLLLLGKHPK